MQRRRNPRRDKRRKDEVHWSQWMDWVAAAAKLAATLLGLLT